MTAAATASPRLLALTYAAVLGAIGAFAPFLGLVLHRQGFDAATIGLLFGLVPLARFASTPLWAAIADRYRLGSRILQGAAVLTTAAVTAIATGWLGVVGLGVALVAYAVSRAPVSPVLDGLTVQSLEQVGADPGRYGHIRLWGSVGFLFTAGAAAWLAEHSGWASAPVGLAAVTFAAGAFITLRLPHAPAARPVPLRPGLRALAGRPGFWLVAAALSLHGMGMNAYDAWYAVHLEHIGLRSTWTGAAIALGVGAEVAVMAGARPLLRGRDPAALLALAAATGAARWALVALLDHPVLLTLLQVSHGVVFGVGWLAAVELFRRWAPSEVRASAQAVLVTCGYAVGPLLTSLTAAAVVDTHGTQALFGVAAAAGLGATGLLLWAWRLGRRG